MIPPTASIPGGFMASAIPGAGMFNPVGVQTRQATDKTAQSAEGVDAAAELTLQGEALLTCFYVNRFFLVKFFFYLISYRNFFFNL